MRIATWNVNSIRSRIDRVTGWLERNDVDVLAIQETKCREDQFPGLELSAMGYEYAHFGLSQWNGVALISRVGLEDVATRFAEDQPMFGDPEVVEARSIGATCGGVRVWSLYVPNGRELDNPHYTYKLAWLERLRQSAAEWLAENPTGQIALTGDWNVAPQDEDVWDTSVFEGKTHVSAPERAAFQGMLDAGFTDVVRPFTPGEFTYWDYQQLAFPKKRGLRIDFVLASEALAARVDNAWIDREERKGKGASDHAPVVIDIT
ncbi:exodeoxyribonuclease III [Aeromicrobium sp. A1-2]|uniref:exodeoxyribonuclease III n=1 Tax=Aeromicrobium sp. A1-2 TaxID=2107713 RepID=UPI000E4EA61D|nr:exodeoxyribonuclease III [Aeromicrobium sp. A1-2]AXT86100.1 exodeoxyribonuclease III [Aeromicrobium sp. A1-2]